MKISVGKKLFASFVLVLCLMVVVGLVSYYTINGINACVDVERQDLNLSHFFAEKVTDHMEWVNAMYETIYLGKEFKKQLDPTKCAFGEWYYSFKTDDPKLKEVLATLEEPHRDLHESANLIMAQLKDGNKAEAERIFKEKTNADLTFIRGQFKQLDQILTDHEAQVQQETETKSHGGLVTLAVAIVLALLLGLGLAAYLTRYITAPVNTLTDGLTKVAVGNLDVRFLENKSNDELGVMATAFNAMVTNLKNIIQQISTTSQSVSITSDQLSNNSLQASKATQQVAAAIQEVAKGASEQASYVTTTIGTVSQVNSAIQQIAAGAEEQASTTTSTAGMVAQMATSIQEVASGATTVSGSAQKTREAAVKGEKAVELTIKGMDGIKEKVFETANKIKELGEHSQQIGEIIQVIDDIAEQTNLLALNAAIEAARAGEHGKGFAVVADEVRKLAERSGKATKEIADLINNIQKLTGGAVLAMEQGTNEVGQGVKLAVDAGQALKEILSTAEETYSQVQNISASAEQISADSQEVVQAINNVSVITEQNTVATQQLTAASNGVSTAMDSVASVTQQTSASAQEVSAATEQMSATVEQISTSAKTLSDMADSLNEVVGKFMIHEITRNCWDIMNCDMVFRKKCTAYQAEEKRCWLLEGTWCGGVQQGDARSKRHRCMNCKAFKAMTDQ